MDTIRPFFPKIRALFLVFKKGQARPPPSPPLVARTYHRQWFEYCKQNNLAPVKPNITEILEFFQHLVPLILLKVLFNLIQPYSKLSDYPLNVGKFYLT